MGRQIKTSVAALSFMYDRAHQIVATTRCPKCWANEVAFKCFGRQTQCYTVPDPSGVGAWVFDVDRARQLIGKRIDGELPPDIIANGIGLTEPGHEFCLLRRANAGQLPPTDEAVGILLQKPELSVLIDGTHRGRLCVAAGVCMPVAVLTPAEIEIVTMIRPPNTVAQLQAFELDRLAGIFQGMDPDAFFGEMVKVLGKEQLTELLGDQG